MSATPQGQLPEAPGEGTAISDCWNQIGVRGDNSCELLSEHIHCRNCPVYSSAAIRVLDRGTLLPGHEKSLADATRLFAGAQKGDQRAANAAFVFRIGGEWLALPMAVVDEVADLRNIHSLPHRRGGVVLGVTNVRGELLVCVSLGQLLGIDPLGENLRGARRVVHPRLLVLRNGGERLAFPVDEAHGAERFDEADLKPVPTTIAKASARYSRALLRWRDHSVGLVDAELLFHSLGRSLG